jgi:aminomethyltransferase
MTACAGWDMPEWYSSIGDEHEAVRTRAGLFDLSPMGQVEVAGRDALAAVQVVTSSDAARLGVGQLQYSALTTPAGTFLDDLRVYRLARSHFLLVVNPANTAKDVRWVGSQAKSYADAAVLDTSSRYALLALQGPAARDVLQLLTGADLQGLEPEWFTHGEVAGVRATIACTGITGERGYEILVPPGSATKVWDAILAEGQDAGVVPAGLAALDTLRLEAGIRRHGQDIDETTTVLEAGLEPFVDWEKGEFVGRAALVSQKLSGLSRRLAGFEMTDRAIARQGDEAYVEGEKVGVVTSGTQTPFVNKAIGLAYLPIAHTEPGREFEIDVRGRRAGARVVPLPFYTRAKG